MSKAKLPTVERFSPKTGKMKKQGEAKPRFLHVVENLAKAKTDKISINCDILSVTAQYFNFQAEYDFGDLAAAVETKELLKIAKLIGAEPFKVIPNFEAGNLEFVWAGNSALISAEPPLNDEHASGFPRPISGAAAPFAETFFSAGAGVGKDAFFDKKFDLKRNQNLDRVILDGTHMYSCDGYLLAKCPFPHSYRPLTIHGSAYRLFRSLDLPPFEDVDGCWEVYDLGVTIKFEGGFELFCLEPPKCKYPDIYRITNDSEGVSTKIPSDFWKMLKNFEASCWVQICGSAIKDDLGKSFKLFDLPFELLGSDGKPLKFKIRPKALLRLAELVSDGSRFFFTTKTLESGVTESWLSVEDPCGDFFHLAGSLRKVEG